MQERERASYWSVVDDDEDDEDEPAAKRRKTPAPQTSPSPADDMDPEVAHALATLRAKGLI